MEILSIRNVSLTYYSAGGETVALDNFSLSADEGEFVAIVGPSGCGKTSILSLICGLIEPTKGTIAVNGLSPKDACGKVGYMLQRDHLFDWRTIRKNVMLGLEIQGKMTPDNIEFADSLLKKYGLEDFMQSHPSQLSGGMKQRAALIRTLALKPDLLLLDEPFSALDYQTRLNVCDDVTEIIRSEGKTAILVTHDISEAISMADRIYVLTARPAYVKKEFRPDFTEKTPLLRRENEHFPKWFDTIWKELQE